VSGDTGAQFLFAIVQVSRKSLPSKSSKAFAAEVLYLQGAMRK
jgi:hypothetical protein